MACFCFQKKKKKAHHFEWEASWGDGHESVTLQPVSWLSRMGKTKNDIFHGVDLKMKKKKKVETFIFIGRWQEEKMWDLNDRSGTS